MTTVAQLFSFLKIQSKDGFTCRVHDWRDISWETIETFFKHWCKTGEDQLCTYQKLLDLTYWVRVSPKGNLQIRPDEKQELFVLLHDLFNGRYIFGVEHVTKNQMEVDFYKTVYEYLKTRILPKGSKRRAEACKVTHIKSVREAVFNRDGYKCVFCGSTVDLTVDHVIPITEGGKDTFDNFQTLCHRCNSGKSNKVLVSIAEGRKEVT